MMLRGRVAAITACVVAAAVVGTGVITWFATRHHLLTQLDQTLLDKQVPTLTTIHDGATGPTLTKTSLLCDPPEHRLQQFLEASSCCGPTARAAFPTVWTGWSPRRRTTP